MFWCAHINQTNFHQNGTILDDFNLRYKIEGKYDSTDVAIYTFHMLDWKIIDSNNQNKKYFLRVHGLLTTEKRFLTMKDLLPYVQIVNKSNDQNQPQSLWVIQLESLPTISLCFKSHAISSIPVTTFGLGNDTIEYDHTSIEWNDFDSFIIQYCQMYAEFFSDISICYHEDYSSAFCKSLASLCLPACDGIDNRPESSIFTHVVDKVINEDKLIVVDTLYDHGHNIASNLSWTKIVLDHLLYLHDTYNYDNCYSTVSLRQQYQRAYVYYQQLYQLQLFYENDYKFGIEGMDSLCHLLTKLVKKQGKLGWHLDRLNCNATNCNNTVWMVSRSGAMGSNAVANHSCIGN